MTEQQAYSQGFVAYVQASDDPTRTDVVTRLQLARDAVQDTMAASRTALQSIPPATVIDLAYYRGVLDARKLHSMAVAS